MFCPLLNTKQPLLNACSVQILYPLTQPVMCILVHHIQDDSQVMCCEEVQDSTCVYII